MDKIKTGRGFALANFKDSYGSECSLQKSSNVIPHVWLGVNDAEPKIMASQAAAHGVVTEETTGWVPYPVPEEVLMTTRMHLTQEQALTLANELLYFGLYGELFPV